MELKDVVLSTLAEMEENEVVKQELNDTIKENQQNNFSTTTEISQPEVLYPEIKEESKDIKSTNDELYFLTSVRERLLVLFEGFQAPNNKEIEAKIDMTLNFLEYTLATIDKRVEKLQKGDI